MKSEFKGQLPKPFASGSDATRKIPSHMNDLNLEEPTRYVSVSDVPPLKCQYLLATRELMCVRETLWK